MMSSNHFCIQSVLRISLVLGCLCLAGCSTHSTEPLITPAAKAGGSKIMQVAAVQNEDPYIAGRLAAQALHEKMVTNPPHVVIVVECYDEKSRKQKMLKGISSVFPKEKIFGCATYGSFTQAGCLDRDSVTLLGIGGDGISVAAVLRQNLNITGLTMENDQELIQTRLSGAGAEIAQSLPRTSRDRLLIIMPDAHSPKNQFLVEGVQTIMGKDFPITGGSANKNAGQTYVYFRGRMYEDSAVAFLLSGDFTLSLAGRLAKSNDRVIATAGEGAGAALRNLKGKPFAMLAFNCAGRKGKLDNIEDELTAIQKSLGKEIPLFGCYCAGEIGPADQAGKNPDVLSSGVGWHVMFTALGQE